MQRFWDKVNKNGAIPKKCPDLGPCWIWLSNSRGGYGLFKIKQKNKQAHRVAYELLIGPLSQNDDLHHICEVKICCNPYHMQKVRPINHPGAGPEFQRSKTHCPRGHEYTVENTYVFGNNFRACRICAKERSQKRYSDLKNMGMTYTEYLEARRQGMIDPV